MLKAYWLAPTVAGRLLAGCSVLADRLSGVIALLVIGLTAVAARHFGLSLLGSGGVGIFLLAAALTASTFGLSVLGRVGSLLPQSGRLKGLVDQLQPYHDRPEVFRRSVGWGLSVQLLNVLVVMELGAAMGLGLPAGAYCLAVPAVALLTILPVSISGVGVREGALVWMLASYGVSQELAVTLGLLWFLVTVVSGLAGGIVYLCGVQAATAPLAPCGREAEREGWGAAQTSSPSPQPSPVEGEGAVAPLAPCGRGAGGEGWNRLVASIHPHPNPLPSREREKKAGEQPMLPDGSSVDDDSDSPVILSMRRSDIAAMSLSVVVPMYNEVENLDRLVETVCRELNPLGQSFEIIVVDDGSTDGSAERLDELAAEHDCLKAVHLRRNYGQTAAMDAGIHLATSEVIVTLDADLQNDPADIPAMVAKLEEGYDLVHGWRKDRHDALVSRRIPSRIANWLISRVTGFPVHDLGCTLKAMRRETAHELHLYGEMHRFIPILAYWNGARCAEMVTRHHPRIAGTSKYGISRTIRVLFDLVTVKYMIQYLSSPMKLFGMLGLGAGFVGLTSATITFAMWLDGFHLSRNPLLLLSIFAGFVSVQFFVLGLLGELGVRTYYESQAKRPYGIRRLVNFADPPAEADRAPRTGSRNSPGRVGWALPTFAAFALPDAD